ncbi:MAG: glycosyltransferase [Cryobacterium sp.]|nr:glycosyltransferase [Cryobacterium sp.]
MLDAVSLLDGAPEGLRRFAYRIAQGRGPLGKLADAARFRFSRSDIPDPPQPGDAAVRLLIGPANSAGQGSQWARAVEKNLSGVAAIAMQGIGADPMVSDADLGVPVAVYQRSTAWHAAFEQYLAQLTHVIWESGLPLLGRQYGSDVLREVAQLREHGVGGALLFHGSDIRPPARHAARSQWSPFRNPSGAVRALEDGASRNAALVAESGLPVFVSTPDLLEWLPQATWCPVVVDPAVWRADPTRKKSGGPPVVVHAPSRAWLKGTDRIEPMLHRLSEEGVIDYRRSLGTPHELMPAMYADADIVLDQFALGSYGVAACEAMASGRLVMCHVDESTRDQVRDLTGSDVPLHEATIETLESELRRAAAEPEEFDGLRAAGPAFVDEVHDGRRSAVAFAPFLGVTE